ncbi:MAG: SagB/ThcOx family dehydrogenase [Planctomycetota bacterium]|jgi:SagB-type dehydrogenase family enzyme
MKNFGLAAMLLSLACCAPARYGQQSRPEAQAPADTVALPAPDRKGSTTLERTLRRRRSVRDFEKRALSRAEIGQLLWAAQGTTKARYRTAPSAGALYPLELYVADADGVFRYEASSHRLRLVTDRDVRLEVHAAALEQAAVRGAPALIVFTAVYERTAKKYGGRRAPRYAHMEAGHAAQNLLLQATALGLGAVPIGAFSDDGVRNALSAPDGHRPLYVIPVGHPKGGG